MFDGGSYFRMGSEALQELTTRENIDVAAAAGSNPYLPL